MAGQLKLRRGTTSQLANFVGSEGELTYDTTRKQLRVHDGSKVGGLPTTDDYLAFMPIPYPKSTPPVGYLVLMGQAISQATYPILYALYGATLPDLRGQFLRGLDYGIGVDVGRTVLSAQGDSIGNHRHDITWQGGAGSLDVSSPDTVGFVATGGTPSGTTRDTGGVETRPKNIAFLYIVKAG